MLEAYRDHGDPQFRIREGIAAAPARLAGLERLGIDRRALTNALEREGVKSFADSYEQLVVGIVAKAGALAGR
jgi:transaldolase/transaldolase/glucose-6-phosphate isomerase